MGHTAALYRLRPAHVSRVRPCTGAEVVRFRLCTKPVRVLLCACDAKCRGGGEVRRAGLSRLDGLERYIEVLGLVLGHLDVSTGSKLDGGSSYT